MAHFAKINDSNIVEQVIVVSNDVFIAPKPYSSWILNDSTYLWEAPVDRPDDGKFYAWNESNLQWEEI